MVKKKNDELIPTLPENEGSKENEEEFNGDNEGIEQTDEINAQLDEVTGVKDKLKKNKEAGKYSPLDNSDDLSDLPLFSGVDISGVSKLQIYRGKDYLGEMPPECELEDIKRKFGSGLFIIKAVDDRGKYIKQIRQNIADELYSDDDASNLVISDNDKIPNLISLMNANTNNMLAFMQKSSDTLIEKLATLGHMQENNQENFMKIAMAQINQPKAGLSDSLKILIPIFAPVLQELLTSGNKAAIQSLEQFKQGLLAGKELNQQSENQNDEEEIEEYDDDEPENIWDYIGKALPSFVSYLNANKGKEYTENDLKGMLQGIIPSEPNTGKISKKPKGERGK